MKFFSDFDSSLHSLHNDANSATLTLAFIFFYFHLTEECLLEEVETENFTSIFDFSL